jgi:hypothetical protein
MLTVAPKPTPVAQADFGRNLKLAPAAKLFVFSDFSFALAFQNVLFVFCILSPPRVAKSTTIVASKVCFTRQSNVDFVSQVASQSPLCTANKVNFGFKVTFQSLFYAAQSRLRFSSRILMSALPASKVDSGCI